MKFLPLVWAGVWRRPMRSVLTALSIAVAFLLLGLLEGVNAGFEKAIAESHRDYLVTQRRMRGGAQMPIASLDQIRAIPGVRTVTLRAYFMGQFGADNPRNTAAAIATEPEVWLRVVPNFVASPEHIRAVTADRMGMLVIMAVVGGLTFQIFINIGMALGISPVIGVPLPLMSAGLASLIATFIAIGFAISVQLRRFVN